MNVDQLLTALRAEWQKDMGEMEARLMKAIEEKTAGSGPTHGHREYIPFAEWNKNVQIINKRFEQIEAHLEVIERNIKMMRGG